MEPLLGSESWMAVQEEARYAIHECGTARWSVRLRDKLSEVTSS